MRKFIVISIVLLMIAGFVLTSSALACPGAVDIKPQSCPNPLNVKDKGVLPVAILGTVHIDVTLIDPATIRLEGVAPLRWDLEDVATPFDSLNGIEDCMDCHEEGPDGVMDLTLKFDVQEIIEIITALGAEDGDCVTLHLTGDFYDEVHYIHGEDEVKIIKKGKP